MIDASTVDWRRLTDFATRLTYPAHGLACVVRGVPGGDGFLGHAGKAAQFFEIELSMAQARPSFTRTFLHELGHLVQGHCSRPIAEPGLTVYNFQYLGDARIRKMAEDRHALIEREAEQFADVAQRELERQLGAAWVDWPFVGTVAGNGA